MSLSGKQLLTGFAVVALLLVGAANLLRYPEDRPNPADNSERNISTGEAADVRTKRETAGKSAKVHPKNRTAKITTDVTTGVKVVPVMATPAALPPLTGFVVDAFEEWTTIPETYRYDGLTLRNGALTLAGDPDSTETRFGEMVSPPIPLNAPSLAAPASASSSIPEGASIGLEISLSDDGLNWSPWAAVEKYRLPDGKRVTPQLQATLSESDVKLYAERRSSATASSQIGPALRYRLNLSASGTTPPSINDVRIWKRE